MWKKPEVGTARGKSASNISAFPTASEPMQGEAAIGPTISIKGDINGSEQLVIHGKVEGSITIKENDVIVSPKGHANTKIFSRSIRIEGDAQGDLKATDLVTLKNTARVYGTITTPRIVIEDGCKFKGSIDTDGEARSEARLTKVEAKPPHSD